MKEVSQEEFYAVIYDGKLDVVLSVIGDYPYTTEFKFRNGRLFGKAVSMYERPGKVWPVIIKYYLA